MWLRKFLPRETNFFGYFDRHAALVVKSAEAFQAICRGDQSIETLIRQIKTLEHEADNVTHQAVDLLRTTFITPFEREDIFSLISRMDDVIDNIDAAAEDLLMYKIKAMRLPAVNMVDILVDSVRELEAAVNGLKDLEKESTIRVHCKNINRLEGEADQILRNAIGQLFDQEHDVRELIKWKEIYENLEQATDRCEDVANIIEGVILEFS